MKRSVALGIFWGFMLLAFLAAAINVQFPDPIISPMAPVFARGNAQALDPAIEPEGALDLGFVPCGEKVVTVARIRHHSANVVHVVKVRSGCPCTEAAPTESGYAPEKPIELRLTFTAPSQPTAYVKPVYVETDDPKNKVLWILLKADVGTPLTVECSPPGMLAVPKGEQAKVRVANRGTNPARLLYCTSSSSVTLQVPSDPIPAGGTVEVPVITNGECLGKTVTFNVTTDVTGQEDFRFTLEITTPASAAR